MEKNFHCGQAYFRGCGGKLAIAKNSDKLTWSYAPPEAIGMLSLFVGLDYNGWWNPKEKEDLVKR
jgi:hypothetical protein